MSSAEWVLLRLVIQYHELHQTVLTPQTFKDAIEEEEGKSYKLLQELHSEYEELYESLSPYSEEDLSPIFRGLIGVSVQEGMEKAWKEAKQILTSDPKITVRGEEGMTKYEKAFSHLRQQLTQVGSKLSHLSDNTSQNLSVTQDANLVRENYALNKHSDDDIDVSMGIPSFDAQFGFRRGHFAGILGFGGHRKSTLLRTWVYNIASRGHKVGYWALEMGPEDEFHMFHLMHCQKKYGACGFNIKDYLNGTLNPKAENLFYKALEEDELKRDLKGEILYRSRGSINWFELSKEIEEMVEEEGIVAAAIDYLTLVECSSKGNEREAMNRQIQSVKPFAKSNNILLISPVQGNREGLERATQADGQWDPSGIDTYSGYFRAMDSIIGVYSPRDIQDRMQLSMVKTRHGVYLDPLTVNVCPDTGMISV